MGLLGGIFPSGSFPDNHWPDAPTSGPPTYTRLVFAAIRVQYPRLISVGLLMPQLVTISITK